MTSKGPHSTRISCLLALLFIITMLFCNGSEVSNEKSIIFMSDGKTPANFAKVQLIPVDYVPASNSDPSKIQETYTDADGKYSFDIIPRGLYNLIARKDSLASFIDSMFISTPSELPADTLSLTRSFSARVLLQPNHDPRTVIIQVLGTTIYYANVDSTGYFNLPDMPEGFYQIRLETSIPSYTPTFYNLTLPKPDTAIPQIKMIYTGIPVVSGLRAVYNPLSAVIKVSWNPVSYQYLSNYILYRDDPKNSAPIPTNYANVKDTFFYDSLAYMRTDSKSTVTFRYRVAVQNRSMAIGEIFEHIDCKAILSNSLPKLFQKDTLRFVPNTPCNLHIQTPEELGGISVYEIDVGATGSFSSFSGPDTTLTIEVPGDSIITDLPCIVVAHSNEGIAIKDTIHLQSNFSWKKQADIPVQNASGFRSLVYNNRLFLFFEINKNNTHRCELWSSPNGNEWSRDSDSLPVSDLTMPPLIFNNQICILNRDTTKDNATVWYSEDGKNWHSKETDSLTNNKFSAEFDVWSVFSNKLLLINYNPPCDEPFSCQTPGSWISDNGFNWYTTAIKNGTLTDKLDTPNKHFIACEYNGQFVMCGAWRSFYLTYPVWSTYALRIWSALESDPIQIQLPSPVYNDVLGEYNPSLVYYKKDLLLTAQLNMENSIDLSYNTKYMWVLLSNNRWYLCSDSYPAQNNSTMKSYYHSMCVFDGKLLSFSNNGVWTIVK